MDLPADEEIIAEAIRRKQEAVPTIIPLSKLVIQVIRERWSPPAPAVAPDLIKAREFVAAECENRGDPAFAKKVRSGTYDQSLAVGSALAAYNSGREITASHAAVLVEYVETRKEDGRPNALEAQIAELKEALRPLAECAMIGSGSGPLPDDYGARYFITYGEIRRARKALNRETGE
jgi:hypothetical protein